MIRLLLVEDETLFRLGLSRLLSLTGEFLIVGEAGDGEQAIALIAALKPDVVIMDIQMPHMSGIAALQKLRQSGDITPVILITTFDDEESFLLGMRAGASAFLRKDIALEDLTSAIHSAKRRANTASIDYRKDFAKARANQTSLRLARSSRPDIEARN